MGGANGVTCSPDYGGACFYCSQGCTAVNVTGPYCGDNIQNGQEECDGSASTGFVCTNGCKLQEEAQPYCGDGIVNSQDEVCDDGNNANGDCCDSACLREETPIPAFRRRYYSKCDWR